MIWNGVATIILAGLPSKSTVVERPGPERPLPKIETTITARAAFGRAAGPVERAVEAPRTVALGVARKGKRDFRLAVRDAPPQQWRAEVDRGRPVVHDGGFTEVEPGTATALFLAP